MCKMNNRKKKGGQGHTIKKGKTQIEDVKNYVNTINPS